MWNQCSLEDYYYSYHKNIDGSNRVSPTVDGGASFFMSYMDECNTESHIRSRGLGDYLPGGKWGAWVFLSPSDPLLPSSTFYQPVLSGETASNIKNLKGLSLSSYTLGIWGGILQVLEAESQHTPILSPEVIKRAKGEGVNTKNQFITFIKAVPEDLSIN